MPVSTETSWIMENGIDFCLLNKINVIDHHLLIVTRRFEDQEILHPA